MRTYVEMTEEKKAATGMEMLCAFDNGKRLYAAVKDSDFSLELKNGRRLYIFGDIFYYIKDDGSIKVLDKGSDAYLKKLFTDEGIKDVVGRLEGQYVGIMVDDRRRTAVIFGDRYARADVFYAMNGSDFFLATDMDFIFRNVKPQYDQKMLAHMFCVYGWYTPKGLTIYGNVKQLRVGEIIKLSVSGVCSEFIRFKPHEIVSYKEKDLDVYYRILRDSVVARANRKGRTWVSSSSGWDSSMLLGMLVDNFGSKDVGMLTASIKYSPGTGVINKFEIEKVKKIGAFYGVKPEIEEVDFMDRRSPARWEKVLSYYRSKHIYTYITYNYSRFSDRLSRIAGDGQTIFNGETSDSFHNFGFSQFATFFHTKKIFTEYADKMNCYLYGPSFLKKVIDGTYEKDKVFQMFKKMTGADFESGFGNRDELLEGYLFPFFYGGPRLPFARTYKNSVFNQNGQRSLYEFPYREYMPEVLARLNEKNIYSWLIYLYHSFHSQGSTVNVLKHAMERNGHRWRSPFNDYRIIEFLSKAPENWGRGLEFNNTKYPLKWVARNKIKFPYELLDEGPHSYLYDVIEGFSLFAEITYRSGVTDFFRGKIGERAYRSILDDRYFNMKYLDGIATDFLNGKEAKGADFNNLVSLITLTVTGWY